LSTGTASQSEIDERGLYDIMVEREYLQELMAGDMEGVDPHDYYEGLMDIEDLISVTQVEAFPGEDSLSPAVIGFFPDNAAGDKDLEAFYMMGTILIEEGTDIRFASVTSPEVLHELGYEATRVYSHKPESFLVQGEKRRERYSGVDLAGESFSQWLMTAATPQVGTLTWESSARYEGCAVPEVTMFTHCQEGQEGLECLAAAARELRLLAVKPHCKDMVFNVASALEQAFRLVHFHGVEPPAAGAEKWLQLGIRSGEDFYTMKEEYSLAAAEKYLMAFAAGSLTPVTGAAASGGAWEEL
ncbi:unnamed protein product, partial [Chrysoparadoxa australica]